MAITDGAGVRVVSWNIRDLLGDPLAVHRVLVALRPDVVCLQEAPRRPGGGLRISQVARATELRHVGGGRTSGGTAILVAPSVRVEAVIARKLPVAHWYTRRRGYVIAALSVRGVRTAVASIHLPLSAPDRLAHAQSVRAALQALPWPSVVGGDFNEPEGGPAWQVFADLVHDPAPGAGPTYPAPAPGARIDAVLVGGRLRVLEYDPDDLDLDDVRRASDHLPVVAVIGP